MITMKDIIRDDNPNLRKVAEKINFPLSEELKKTATQMIEFLKNSQDEEISNKYDLRPGVGIAAPQLDIPKRMFAVHIPAGNEVEEDFSLVMINPRIIRHSVKKAVLPDGEGCLSVDDPHEGYVPRKRRITVEYFDLDGKKHKNKFKKFPAFVIQHELDHLNGVLFYDLINKNAPFHLDDDTKIFEDK